MTRPHPWLPEAHDLGPTTSHRIRSWWHRILHPHTAILDRLQRLQITLCPFCDTVNPDPSDNCPRCGL